ncbi:PAS domain S-box protein [Candidatus Riflebacteria bacterium]
MEDVILKEMESIYWEWNLVSNFFYFYGNLTGFARIKQGEEIEDLLQLCQKFAHNEEKEKLASIFKKTAEKILENGLSFKAVGKNGELRWLYIPRAIVKKYHAKDKPEMLLGTIIDITGVKRNKEEGQKHKRNQEKDEARWISSIETAVDGIITINEVGIIESVNSGCEIMFGYNRKEMVGQNISMLVPEPHRQNHDEYIKNYLTTGIKKIIGTGREIEALRKDGILFPADLAISEFQIEGKSFFTGIVRDISDRKEQQRDQARWRSAIETAVDGIITINETGIIESVNSATEKTFGYCREEMLGQNISMLVPAPHKQKHDGYLKNYLATGLKKIIGIGREIEAQRKDGTLFPADLAISEFKLKGKSYFTGMVRDITARKEAEEQLRKLTEALKESNRELENFASIASHDLQEPLRKISAFSDMLTIECEDSLDEDGKIYLNKIEDAANRMSLLIRGLLEFSRVSRRELLQTTVNLNILIKDIISDLEVKINETGTEIEVGELSIIQGGEILLRQLFQNLILNSMKFVQKGVTPKIKISSQDQKITKEAEARELPEGNYLEISVQDNGIGIEEKYQQKVFDIFKRLHKRTDYEGSGIGLAVCQKIAYRHGGIITLKSTPGKGTTFKVLLPLK